MNFDFRKARAEELEETVRLYGWVKGQPGCTWSEDYPSRLEAEADLAAGGLYVLALGTQLCGALSVVPENELDGFACCQNADGGHREIARVVIAPPFQGRGLAAEMVGRIGDVLAAMGVRSIRLAVAKINPAARKTYLKCGFVPREATHMYGNDYILMEKQL